ncbi:MAG: DUF4145 domain-containing protein [Thermoleophilia bacterium]|nr:DUF4145 domain-containing protein [Thermoleophilia bacterium]
MIYLCNFAASAFFADPEGPSAWGAHELLGEGFENDDPVFVYPEPRRLNPAIPPALRNEWGEAKTCFDATAYAACTVMTRRTLEGTCKDLGVSEKNLARALNTLQNRGLIDGMLADWARALRLAGNRGAHFTGEPVSREDAENSLAFTEALLDHVYVLRKRFEKFRKQLDE